MKKIHKQHSDGINTQQPDEKLAAYLTQVARKISGRKVINGSLALLAPLAASSLITNQVNAQACVFPYLIGAQPDVLLDIDGDGLATFLFANVNANFQYLAVVAAPPGDPGGPLNAGIAALYTSGFYYVAHPGSATTNVTFATLNYFGGDPLTGGGTFNVVNANGVVTSINITIAANGAITVNTVNGVAPVICAMLPLPIELTNFDVVPQEKSLKLIWETASETNNKGFEIERSTDGAHFLNIGWIAGEGTTGKTNRYTFEDKDIKANVIYYYRLRQVDLNGATTNSNIVTGKINGEVAIQFGTIAPNPVRNSLRVEIVSKEERDMTYALYDQLGSLVLQGTNKLSQGMNNFNVSVQDVPNGSYYLKMNAGTFSDYKKVIILK